MALSSNAIQFENVDQIYVTDTGPLTALTKINLTIPQHQFVAVLGPSGCGKSTVSRLSAGLLLPTSGQVSVYRTAVTEPRDDVGIVFQ